MAKELYNEGRVVGYSAYEIYVKHALTGDDPDPEIASEKEWLASSISLGSSMLLKVDIDSTDGAHYRDIQLPTNSRLCAANTIMASFFIGEGHLEGGSVWADRVVDYGPLIDNTAISSPSGTTTPASNIPPTNPTSVSLSENTIEQLKEYSKIVDGIVIQPGKWNTSTKKPPEKDLEPNLTSYPRLRLSFSDKITTSFWILFSGFTNRSVISGVSGTDTSADTLSPQDGDFLGPAVFPWANKIIFSIPNALINHIDAVIPGMVKLFEGEDAVAAAIAYEEANPDNYALIRDDSYILHQLWGEDAIPVADLEELKLTSESAPFLEVGRYVNLKVGNYEIPILALGDSGSDPYTLSSFPTNTYTSDYIILQMILAAWQSNTKIDILGEVLRGLKGNLTSSGSNYLKLSGSPTLYISSTQPTGTIPEGSIGIGW